MKADICIVIAAYNRPASLQRLLDSIAAGNYQGYENIPLLISIDHSGNEDCKTIADAFEWKYGRKTVVQHPQNLGLKKHILSCGDLTKQHDAVIVLEDDLLVSPCFYDYAQQAYLFYKADEQVAGIALYHNTFNEVAYCPFEPLNDGFDNYFMQVPCSWGQLWTKKQWEGFVNFLSEVKDGALPDTLPGNVQQWSTTSSWKKYFYSYLLQGNKYFVYPRVGLSTNFGDTGEHLQRSQTVFQTSLLLAKKVFRFSTIDESLSVYDGFFELSGHVYNKLVNAEEIVSFDLNGTKPLSAIKTKYLISSKRCTKPQKQFEVACYPYENNILLNIVRNGKNDVYFSLGQTTDFSAEQQFSRLSVDLERVFINDAFLRQAVRNDFVKSKEFRLGETLLLPFRVVKRAIKKIFLT
jgi:glycosyltransferase involved in cell wall biosynthesis